MVALVVGYPPICMFNLAIPLFIYLCTLQLYIILVPPMIIVSPKDTHLSVGSDNRTLIFPCVSLATVRLIWKIGDTEIVASDSMKFTELSFEKEGLWLVMSVMEICGVSTDESGVYSCVAENEMGRTTAATFDLCVISK